MDAHAEAQHDVERLRTASGVAPERVLSVENLARSYGAREVVRSLDLSIAAGGRVALWGPNGSGKTTVLRCIAGTLTATCGTVSVSGHAAGTLAARRLIGVSFSQERAFYQRLTCHENLLFFARVRGADRRAVVQQVRAVEEELELGFVGARVDRCSTGMIQQLSFARALLGSPALLLLDEPTRSLDAAAVERLWAALDRRQETSLVLATHRRDDADRCDETIQLPV